MIKKDSDIESDDRYYEDDDSDYNEFSETKYKDFYIYKLNIVMKHYPNIYIRKIYLLKKRWIFVYKFYME